MKNDPLEAARAAERGITFTIDSTVRMGGCPTREVYAARDALRALIAAHERLTAQPTDDDREALAAILDPDEGETLDRYVERRVERIIALGFSRHEPGPVTDAVRALSEWRGWYTTGEAPSPSEWLEFDRRFAVLEAARSVDHEMRSE